MRSRPVPDAPDEDGQRCDHCPLDRLDAAQCAEKDCSSRRALDLMGALKLGAHIGLDEIRADLLEPERVPRAGGR